MWMMGEECWLEAEKEVVNAPSMPQAAINR